MKTTKLDLAKFPGAKPFTSKDGTKYMAIPYGPNNVFEGKNGAAYLSTTDMDNRDGADQYGWEGFTTVDIGKDRREAGEKGPIVGNWKHIGQAPARSTGQNGAKPPIAAMNDELDQGDDIPF